MTNARQENPSGPPPIPDTAPTPLPVPTSSVASSWSLYLRWARESWWMIAITAVLGLAGGLWFASTSEDVYASDMEAALTISNDILSPTERVQAVTELNQALVATAGELFDSNSSLVRAGESVEATGTPIESPSSYDVTATPSLVGYTINVTVQGADPEVTQAVAAAIHEQVAADFAELYPGFTLDLVKEPAVPDEPTASSATLTVLIGLAIGIGVGALIAIFRGARSLQRRSGSWTR